ncbi:MAG: CvpA family protein [Lentihominibacter sp.]
MIFDLIVLAFLIIPMAVGLYRGFVNMFMRALGWVLAVAAGFFLAGTAADYLGESAAGEQIRSGVLEKFSESADNAAAAADGLPDMLRGGIAFTAQSSAEIFAGLVSSMLITLTAFIIIVLFVKLLLHIAVKPASRRKKHSIVNASDRLLGLVAGFVEGILIAFLFLAVLVPVMNLSDPRTGAEIAQALENSYIAGTLYDNNLLLLVTGGLMS